jgi:hypothetical protein
MYTLLIEAAAALKETGLIKNIQLAERLMRAARELKREVK